MELRQISRTFAETSRQLCSGRRLVWVLIGLGVFLRLAQYSANRSLWLDESFLALNIIHRSLGGLLQPLDYGQGAPVGFLILEKLVVQVFGSSEYALRLVPLISGIVSLPLFYEVARHVIRPRAVPIALGLFAILDPLIYYSSEVKQYSSDVAVALALFASAQIVRQGSTLSIPRPIALAIVGALAPWFSHPAAFILMGVGTVAFMVFYRNQDWSQIRRLSIVVLIWTLSLALFYYVSLYHLTTKRGLLEYWGDAFLPFPPSFASVRWLGITFFNVFDFPVGLWRPGIGVGALAFLVCAFALWTENRTTFLALLLPLFFALAASAFRLYPFDGRLLLFGVPFIVLLIGEGAERIVAASKHHLPMVGLILAALLFLPALSAGTHLVKARTREEIRPVIAYISTHKQDGDVLYVYHSSVPAFKYYADRYGFATANYVKGIDARCCSGRKPITNDERKKYTVDLDRLQGQRRTWILFSHVYTDEKDFFLYYLDTQGTRLDAFEGDGAEVYLYDLSRDEKRTERRPPISRNGKLRVLAGSAPGYDPTRPPGGGGHHR